MARPSPVAEIEGLITRSRPPVRFGRRSLATDTVDGDLDVLLACLRAAGVGGVVAVDLTRPEIGISVVKVVATELEGPYGWAAPNVRQQALLAAS